MPIDEDTYACPAGAPTGSMTTGIGAKWSCGIEICTGLPRRVTVRRACGAPAA